MTEVHRCLTARASTDTSGPIYGLYGLDANQTRMISRRAPGRSANHTSISASSRLGHYDQHGVICGLQLFEFSLVYDSYTSLHVFF